MMFKMHSSNNRGYINFAKIKGGILYVSTGHKGYTINNPSTGYSTSDWETKKSYSIITGRKLNLSFQVEFKWRT